MQHFRRNLNICGGHEFTNNGFGAVEVIQHILYIGGALVLGNPHIAAIVFIGMFALIGLYIWRSTSARNIDRIDGGEI